MPPTGATLRLLRLDTSLVGFLLLFLPVATRTKDMLAGLLVAAPVLFISMCTFIANDLNDRERDEINHPDRPLPSGHVAPSFAAGLYFVCLAAALFTTRYWVQDSIASWYYLLIALSISYGHIVEFLPSLKAPYVAAVIAIPVLIVASTFREPKLYAVASAAFLFNLGKELCMDVLDRPGDRLSVLHRFTPRHITIAALLLQLASLTLLVTLALPGERRWTTVFLFAVAIFQSVSAYYLIARRDIRTAVHIMRIALLASFYFLAVPSY